MLVEIFEYQNANLLSVHNRTTNIGSTNIYAGSTNMQNDFEINNQVMMHLH